MTDEAADEIARLRSTMLMKNLFVMFRTMLDPASIDGLMLDHYRWIIALEKEGKVFASGPLFEREGEVPVGMTIFKAPDRETAAAWAAMDPFVTGGAMTFDIKRWGIAEGSVNISVNFSDRSYTIE